MSSFATPTKRATERRHSTNSETALGVRGTRTHRVRQPRASLWFTHASSALNMHACPFLRNRAPSSNTPRWEHQLGEQWPPSPAQSLPHTSTRSNIITSTLQLKIGSGCRFRVSFTHTFTHCFFCSFYFVLSLLFWFLRLLGQIYSVEGLFS